MADQFPGATKMVLSPEAQAVLDAAEPLIAPSECLGLEAALAAAFCAAADQPYEVPAYYRGDDYWTYRNGIDAERNRFITIATELENHQ
jgi:hypothetical protein